MIMSAPLSNEIGAAPLRLLSVGITSVCSSDKVMLIVQKHTVMSTMVFVDVSEH